jgi:hypothetical protein
MKLGWIPRPGHQFPRIHLLGTRVNKRKKLLTWGMTSRGCLG